MRESWKQIVSRPTPAAIVGFLFVLPFFCMNAIVAMKLEPMFSWVQARGINNVGGFGLGFFTLLFLLLLLPAGAFVAVRPMFLKADGGGRRWRVLNIAVAAILLAGFLLVTVAVGEEIYRCDILKIPNCD